MEKASARETQFLQLVQKMIYFNFNFSHFSRFLTQQASRRSVTQARADEGIFYSIIMARLREPSKCEMNETCFIAFVLYDVRNFDSSLLE